MDKNKKMYVISESRLQSLLEGEAELDALNMAGVDNWEWYGDHQIEDYGYDCENDCWDVSTSGFYTLEEYNEKLKEK